MSELPAYLRIASDLRAKIVSGQLRAADRLPSLARLMERYAVSSTIVRNALAILAREGLIEGRSGSGVYVRDARRLVRRSNGRQQRTESGSASPFARDAAAGGQQGGWESDSAEEAATEEVAARLAIEPGDPVMRTRYRYLADGHPVQLATSWEPLAVTRGTSVERPEEGAAVGVVARMDHIGVRVDDAEERVTWRAADETELAGLELPQRGGYVLVIRRTYFAAGVPVETADIVLDAGRYELLYRIPIE
ncbi:GntR family transcriptional regulator [Hamadaea tsunoensis]|uniref:GntR family transcriptional regulator n=1 Tax=Hamadaea tsunoensis TaxID=53368 RepID=UPI0004269C59|nr:GntR family transcriptional regulator [Hamadaea tsunoensis]